MSNSTLASEINQNQQLDISIERVAKINSPLLVIGLGGTGADIVRTIKHTFAERYILPKDQNGNLVPVPDKTAYLALDTTNQSQGSLDNSEFVNISLPGLTAILDPSKRNFNLTPYELKWVNKNLNAASSGLGAGTHRQAARLMLFRQYSSVMQSLTRTLQRITSVDAGTATINGRTEIVIAAGISGGTGSGIFLDIAQMVRYIMSKDSKLNNLQYRITGYIIMPDISIDNVKTSPALVGILQRNGFAALKELDFWMRVKDHQTPYVAQFDASTAIPWSMPPFDSCILMSATTVNGTVYNDAYNVAQKTIAENLLHYLANEVPTKDNKGKVTYTYIQYEDNLAAAVEGIASKQSRPVLYGYRAIGAYTMRIPKRKILYFEGLQLFERFIPQRDENMRLVPSDMLFKDGKTVDRSNKIVDDIRTLYANFSQHISLPNFCRTPANDRPALDQLRNMHPEPHERADTEPQLWRSSAVRPAAISSAESYLQAAWKRFSDFASFVITDPNLGPFSLMAYLEDGQGLIKALDDRRNEWNVFAVNHNKDEIVKHEECRRRWADFLHPPLIGGGRAIDNYLEGLNNYYNAVRRNTFTAEHAAAIDRLLLRVREYVRDALTPMCNDILFLEKMFTTFHNDNSRLEGDIFDLQAILDRIRKEMELNNEGNKTVRVFLGDLCTASLDSRPNVDAHTSGLTFTYREKGLNKMLETVRDSLNSCFQAINGQSLDSIMLQTVGTDLSQQQDYMDNLAMSVLNSATPMFSQDTAFASELMAPYSYMSVPDDSPEHINRYRETLTTHNVEPKGSSIHDHIYCITAWDGLPLYRYSQMAALEKVYDDSLSKPNDSMGVHLVWDGELDSDYTSNWTKLPSPRPYYFFSAHGPQFAEASYRQIRDIVVSARKTGLLEINDEIPKPILTFHLYYNDMQRSVLKSSEMLCQEADVILASKDPVTGNKLQPEQALVALKAYLALAGQDTLPCDRSPAFLAASLGLEKQPSDPWDEGISANPTLAATAMANHKLLCEEMAVAVISLQPRLVSSLKQQVDGYAYIARKMNEIEESANVWGPRIQYADQVSLMMIYKVISPSISGFEYVDNTGAYVSVIQNQLLKDDLKATTPLVQCTAHLGDLIEGNQIRFELEQHLREAQASLVDRQHAKTLQRADVEQLQKNVALVKDICKDERNQCQIQLRSQTADVQRLNSILKLLDALVNTADNEDNKFKTLLRIMTD